MQGLNFGRIVALALVTTVLACGSDPAPSGGTGSTGEASTTSSGSTDGQTSATPPPTTMPPPDDDTTYGAGCGPDPCGPCDPGCEVYSLCIASEWTCECHCEPTGTGGPEVCDSLEVALDLWLEKSLNPPIDCGQVDTKSDAAAWQATHDCVVAALAGASFRASWTDASLAPEPWAVGVGGRFVARPERIWYEVSGMFTLTEYACGSIAVVPDCVVDVGQMCLVCERPTEVAVPCTDG